MDGFNKLSSKAFNICHTIFIYVLTTIMDTSVMAGIVHVILPNII